MATDTARVELELASGRNEITASFQPTAQRRHKQRDAASVADLGETQAPTQWAIDAPRVTAPQPNAATLPARGTSITPPASASRPSWIAFIGALIAVGVAVWWVMSQRMPDIDPRVVIERNLNDARTAMAEGHYTDPPERSAFHYYSTVLAVDPSNADAIAGLDAIADRHLTNARVLLADRKIAEAGVALEKARRIRPDHSGLAALDAQWRGELRRILAASTVIAKPVGTPEKKSTVEKVREAIRNSVRAESPKPETLAVAAAPPIEDPLPPPSVAAPKIEELALIAVPVPSPVDEAINVAINEPASEDNVVDAAPPASAGANSTEPKLVKMVPPDYPQEALMRGLEGWVDVTLQIAPSGDVIAPRIEETSRGRMFNRAALAAVQQWKYEPRSNTSERVRVRVEFKQSK